MKAFISSTSLDLGEYRDGAREVCSRLAVVPIGMESFESMGLGATAGSQAKVKEANVYVGIIANRYGYVEAGHDKSVTELEFDYAGQHGLDRLCFVADAAAKLPTYSGDDQVKLAAFKARVDQLIRSTFATPWEFRYKLYDSLIKWLFKQRGGTVLERYVFEPVFADYMRFGGRGDDLARIQKFLDAPDPGYLVITAPAGYGKTALAVKIIELNREACAYHFFTTRYASATRDMLTEQGYLRNVVQQLRLWEFSNFDTWEMPTTLSGWVAAYHQLLKRDWRERHLLLVDALDEASFGLEPYLKVVPGKNLKIIVTVRDVGQDWKANYGVPATHTTQLALAGFSPEDVAAALCLAGKRAAAFADNAALLAKVVTVTTPQAAVAGADPLYVTFLAEAIERGDVTPATVGTQPKRFEDYLATWWKGIVAQAGADTAALDLLGTLAAALGPIHKDDLAALHEKLRASWTGDPIDRLVSGMRRVVAGSEKEGYSFAHPRFRDYVRRFPEIAQYEQKLMEYCEGWRGKKRRYALTYAVRHFGQAREHDKLFATVLDEAFQSEQKEVLGSIWQTLNDLGSAIRAGCENDRFIEVLRCAANYRRLVQSEGIAAAVFTSVHEGRFEAAAAAADAYGFGAKTSSAWVVALRAYLIWAAVRMGKRDAAVSLIDASRQQLGLRCHGSALHVTDLCDTLIASAVNADPSLAEDIGVDAAWAPGVLARLGPPAAGGELQPLLGNVTGRIRLLEEQTGENPNPEYTTTHLDEERAGNFIAELRDSLIKLAGDPRGRDLIGRAIAAVETNPYPRYRDIGLIGLGVAALAVPDAEWTAARLETILETGLEKEGVTFTFDLAAQLLDEAERRGMAAPALATYLDRAENANDRWGTRLRRLSARASAKATQGDIAGAKATLESAATADGGFAGYMSAHLLSIASRWCELGMPARVGELGLVGRSRSHAGRVRDPKFGTERKELVDNFERWFAEPSPEWPDVSATLRLTADADARRAYKDLVSARWMAAGKWTDWGHLITAALNDATVFDLVIARMVSHAIVRHGKGERELTDTDLNEAIALCLDRFATSRPWELPKLRPEVV
ncbi:DUF4062 domain-containing protein [Mesorhizobium escarrei]|uniref:DUF4062 domain-containing protein n=1 Tax=Mesorhizobium escarrei TaxID=666018 RepID=A0ABN8JXE1_9HYPH|nr:DUF4062 domain-containing protein [Mesorhizobium escarrei]CAH2402698.1 hypothetical protein MES5069_350007 [Mesorhizobium escarrei]